MGPLLTEVSSSYELVRSLSSDPVFMHQRATNRQTQSGTEEFRHFPPTVDVMVGKLGLTITTGSKVKWVNGQFG